MFDAIKLFYSCVGVIFCYIYLLGYSTFLMLSSSYMAHRICIKKTKRKNIIMKYHMIIMRAGDYYRSCL